MIRHYKLTFWPEQGVPEEIWKLTDFLQEIKMADSDAPALIHCSAGIGRTGVIAAVDIGERNCISKYSGTCIIRYLGQVSDLTGSTVLLGALECV